MFFFDHCLDEAGAVVMQLLIEPIVAGRGNRIDATCSSVMNSPKRRGRDTDWSEQIRHCPRADVTGFGAKTGAKFPNEEVRSMIGIVLVAHGRLGAEFRAALEHVAGPQKQVESIAIGPDNDIEQRRQDIISAVTKVNDGAGVVVLTDMFGGTPSNLAISIMNGSAVEVIAGVNLAMLIKLALVRETSSLEQAAIQAQDAARKYIYVASQVLGAEPAQIEHARRHEFYHIAKQSLYKASGA